MSIFKADADLDLVDDGLHDDAVVSEKRGTQDDRKDMQRMGKTQELRRNFRFVSIFGYSMILMASWETVLTSVVGYSSMRVFFELNLL
jgi:choline transport protein